jgi:hypothetical protein
MSASRHTLTTGESIIGLGNFPWATHRFIDDLARVVILLTCSIRINWFTAYFSDADGG